ncbi:hypothetical protein CXF29_09855, partial [Corynebacterium bovis]|uniref:hypothetical protein n=1 Tax=Corynebacterium bovis TaxID=36808 RepID=UPI000FBC6429
RIAATRCRAQRPSPCVPADHRRPVGRSVTRSGRAPGPAPGSPAAREVDGTVDGDDGWGMTLLGEGVGR